MKCPTTVPRTRCTILEEARKQKNVPGYHRIRTYYRLKGCIEPLVGWQAKDGRIRTMEHYAAVVDMMSDLLPPDDVDIYPDGKINEGD